MCNNDNYTYQLDCLSTALGDEGVNNILNLFLNRNDADMQLKSLNLPFNQLKQIPSQISRLFPLLETVNLKYNNINSIPTEAFNFTATLKHLDLRYNNIGRIEPFAFQGI